MSELVLYADSADRAAVAALLADRLVGGVTTNPSILVKAGLTAADIADLHAEWAAQGAREIFFQTWGADADELVENGRRIARLGDDVVVKVPATSSGMPAAARLAGDGIPVLVTAVYSVAQAVIAGSIGARYIAPYLGRLEDAGRAGADDIQAMHEVLAGTGCEVLVASIRTPGAMAELARRGIRRITAAPAVLRAALETPASDAASEQFAADAHGWRLD